MRRLATFVLWLLALCLWGCEPAVDRALPISRVLDVAPIPERAPAAEAVPADLPGLSQVPPAERGEVLRIVGLIRAGGPFDYPGKDGSVFGNFERRLPLQPRGYYREYTVPTPGLSHRGPRRIVGGREDELFYTRDHYETFSRLTP
jgi:ribonuclease T1